MRYGFYIGDIKDFDSLIEVLETHIMETLQKLKRAISSRLLRNKLIKLVQDNLKTEIEQYSWTGDEEFVSRDAEKMFHCIFDLYDHDLYLHWKEIYQDEIEECSIQDYFPEDKLAMELDVYTKKHKRIIMPEATYKFQK